MLDKTIVYKNLIMRISHEEIPKAGQAMLPAGFSFSFFKEGDECHWARIEASVLEFDNPEKALEYFAKSFLPHIDELKQRCIFALNPEGLPVATATAWYADSEIGRQAALHWVAVCPEYQGLGLGRAITQKALLEFQALEPNCDVWLHTQTWSHPAIKLYHSLGFKLLRTEKLARGNNDPRIYYDNDYDDAIEVLRIVMDESSIKALIG